MKCQNCGHEYPGTLTRCTRCKQINPAKAQRSQSKLLEFPPRPRPAVEKEPAQAKVPAWRAEVSERVRAAKAKRSGSNSIESDSEDDFPIQSVTSAKQSGNRVETQSSPSTSTGTAASIARPTAVEQTEKPPTSSEPIGRPTSNVVEAALTRVRRASENANRAMLPRIGPSSTQAATKPALSLDKQATARAIEIEEVSRPVEESASVRLPASTRKRVEQSQSEPLSFQTQPAVEPEESYSYSEIETQTEMAVPEMEPRDYLAEEVRKVSRADESYEGAVSLATHIVINAADLLVLILSAAPFLASMMLAGADTINSQTLSAVALVTLVVSFFYFAVTQALCGKTFGMMLTNTSVVSMETGEPLSIQQSLVRTVGYFVGMIPALLGFIWIALNSSRRGLHDIMSGAIVIRDFEDR